MSKSKRKPAQQLHITLNDAGSIEGMTIEFDVDINDMPRVVADVLNTAYRLTDTEAGDEPTVGFHQVKENKDAQATTPATAECIARDIIKGAARQCDHRPGYCWCFASQSPGQT
jgi:hypothetical protein